jgi:hypothetical protein
MAESDSNNNIFEVKLEEMEFGLLAKLKSWESLKLVELKFLGGIKKQKIAQSWSSIWSNLKSWESQSWTFPIETKLGKLELMK